MATVTYDKATRTASGARASKAFPNAPGSTGLLDHGARNPMRQARPFVAAGFGTAGERTSSSTSDAMRAGGA
jgi:hypothetical protein